MKRDWRLLLTASTTATLGEGAFLAALPLLATTMTTDPRLIAGVTAWGTLPWLLSTLAAGSWMDRYDPRRSMMVVQACQALLVCALAAATLTTAGGIALLYAIAFGLGVGETFVKVAVQKLIPAVVPPGGLESANGRQNASLFTAKMFLGPPLGALLFSIAASLPFWLTAVTFAVSALLVSRLRVAQVHSGPQPKGVWEGVRWLAGNRLLRTLALLSGVANLANFMANATLVLFATQRLGLGAVGYGWLVGTMAVGGIAGSLVSGRAVARFGGRAVVTTTIFATPAAMLAIGFVARDLVTMVSLSFVSSAGAALWNVASASLRQRTVPPHLLGRVSSVGLLISWGVQPAGAIVGGLIAASPLGLAGPWIVAGLLRLLAAVMSLRALSLWPGGSPNLPATPAGSDDGRQDVHVVEIDEHDAVPELDLDVRRRALDDGPVAR